MWEALVELNRTAQRLIPEIDTDVGESQEERKKRVEAAYSAFARLVLDNRPFMAPVVYRAGKELMHKVRMQYKMAPRDTQGWSGIDWEWVGKEHEKMEELVESVNEAIRNRIWREETRA